MTDSTDTWSGIFENVPAAEYHTRELGVASAGALKYVRRSLAHYMAYVRGAYEKQRSRALDFGKAAHSYVLEPEVFASEFVLAPVGAPKRPTSAQLNAKKPSFKTLDAIEFWEDFDRINAGKTFLGHDDFQVIQDMRAALDDVDMVGELPGILVREGEAEVTYRWVDPRTGLRCKSRPDRRYRPLRYQMDYKTCMDASHEGCARAVAAMDYHVGHCHYATGAAVLGEPLDNYIFLFQEKEPPYAASMYTVDAGGEARGFEKLHRDMDRLKRGMDSGRFPAYSHQIEQLALPAWAFFDGPETERSNNA